MLLSNVRLIGCPSCLLQRCVRLCSRNNLLVPELDQTLRLSHHYAPEMHLALPLSDPGDPKLPYLPTPELRQTLQLSQLCAPELHQTLPLSDPGNPELHLTLLLSDPGNPELRQIC